MKEVIYCFLSENGTDISRARGASMINQCHGTSVLNKKEYPEYYWALDEHLARSFVNLCYQERCPIIGIDIIVQKNGKYSLSFDVWCYQRKDCEDDDCFLVNSIKGAIKYINYFSKKDNLYSFTLEDCK